MFQAAEETQEFAKWARARQIKSILRVGLSPVDAIDRMQDHQDNEKFHT